jgi:hypothetical protein
VNDTPTPNLDAFLSSIKNIKDNEYFRMTVITLNGVPGVTTIKKNEHYFPTFELVKVEGKALVWREIIH